MKKLLTTIACVAMILVGGLSLAACGSNDEFAKGENATLEEVSTYVAGDEISNSMTSGYRIYTDVFGIKIDGVVSVVEKSAKVALNMEMNANPELGIEEDMHMAMYLKDNYVYLREDVNSRGVKVAIDTDSAEYTEMIEEITKALDYQDLDASIREMVESLQAFEGNGLSIKKLEDENSVKFKISYEQEGMSVVAILSYTNGQIDRYETTLTYDDITMKVLVEAFTGEVEYPADLDADYDLVEEELAA